MKRNRKTKRDTTHSFTANFTAKLLRGIWTDTLQATVQAIRCNRFMCYTSIHEGNFYLYITLYDDNTPVEVEICKENSSCMLSDKHLPNITSNLKSKLKGFWQYAGDKAFLEQIDEARERIQKYETEHNIDPHHTP